MARTCIAIAVAAALLLTAPIARAAEPFVLSSPAFADGARIPAKHRGKLAGSAGCIGENVSPAFAWSNPPAETKSYALVMVDPEARGGSGLVHFLAYGIPAVLTGLAEGELSQASDKFVFGKGMLATPYYLGPCSTSAYPHHYTFILIANDLEPGALAPGLTRDELNEKLRGHAKGVAGLVGLWGQPVP